MVGPQGCGKATDCPSLAGEEGEIGLDRIAEPLQSSDRQVIRFLAQQRVREASHAVTLSLVSCERRSERECLTATVTPGSINAKASELICELLV
jgi:hypothetical protein